MKIKTASTALAVAVSITLLMGDGGDCSGTPTADQRERQATEQLTGQASVQLGLPGITNFTEKRQLKMLYELRDSANLVTYAYYLDLNGGKHKVCPTTAVGYGLPYATQYSNPQKDAFYTSGSSQHLAMPQAEPNGLYMPAAAEGTWVMCLDPTGKSIKPVYVEPRVIVSPFPMTAVD